eukprot:g1549.t1
MVGHQPRNPITSTPQVLPHLPPVHEDLDSISNVDEGNDACSVTAASNIGSVSQLSDTKGSMLSKQLSAFSAPPRYRNSGAFIYMVDDVRPDGRVPGLKQAPEILIFIDEDKARKEHMHFEYDAREGTWKTRGIDGVIRPWFFQKVIDQQRGRGRGNILFQSKEDPLMQVNEKTLFYCLQPKEALPKEAARLCSSNLSIRCNTCIKRIPIFAQLVGSEGEHVYLKEELDDANVKALRSMRNKIKSSDPADYHLVLIDDEFFQANPKEVGPFCHVHFLKEQVSDAQLSERIKKLKNYLNGSFENRFQRLVDDPNSLKVILDVLPELVRPDHWRGVVTWAVNLSGVAEGRKWQDMAVHEKFQVMVYAMLTGRASDSIHLDMQQAGNLVDFMDSAESREALKAMMDDRSNPETYQVSRVADRLRENRVSSLCTVTLMWGLDGAPHQSDLDIHTVVNGIELFYGNPQVGKCKLDFDANASRIEQNPAENISLNQVGTFVIMVNNYNNRDNKDVPFKVTVRKSGQEVAEHEGTWPRTRAKGNKMTVCQVTVLAEDLVEKPVELSEAEQKKLAAKEAEWSKLFGEPRALLASETDVDMHLVSRSNGYPATQGAQQRFQELLQPKAKKQSLAERCKAEELDGFIERVTSKGFPCRLEVDIRNFAPAYITRLETASDVLKSNIVVNVFQRKFEVPQAPRSDEPSSARLDASWGLQPRALVRGFVKVHAQWFMVLENARLPAHQEWPLAGGMYPTNLKPEVHHHRSKWASFHSLVQPEVSRASSLIGSMLVGFSKFHFVLDGKQAGKLLGPVRPRYLLHATYWENVAGILTEGIVPAKNPLSDIRKPFKDLLQGAESHVYTMRSTDLGCLESKQDHLEGYKYKLGSKVERDLNLVKRPWEVPIIDQLGPETVSKNKDVETWDNPEFLLEIREGIAYCTLNRPDANNAMNDGIGGGLHDALRILRERPEIRIAVFTGNGRMPLGGVAIEVL